MKHNITVELGDRSYPIHTGSGIFDDLGTQCTAVGLSGRCLLVSDENVAPLYADRALASLADAGFTVSLEVLPAGEPTKCHEQLIHLYSRAAESGLDRSDFMIALGGGVVGDLTGFAAASWFRGVPYVQVPTSLLAMVDSSVGGKTGLNIAEGKNLVGAFHQPALVLADLETLETLPEREFAAGMAEVIKYGVIWDEELFQRLEAVGAGDDRVQRAQLQKFQGSEALGGIISRCCEIKAEVVRQDEREGGLRGILNFGHTLAHAIEKVAGYGEILHGEAVAIGMIYAAHLSVELKSFSVEESARLEKLIASVQLPVRAPPVEWSQIREALALDKKTRGGILRFVLAERIGKAEFGCEVPEELMEEVWDGISQ